MSQREQNFMPAGRQEVGDRLFQLVSSRLNSVAAFMPGFLFQRRRAVDGTISYPWFTENISQILSIPPKGLDVTESGCLNMIHWADRDHHLEQIRLSAETLSPCPEDFRIITEQGDVRWLRGGSIPRQQDDGSIIWDGAMVDVTEGRRAELRLDMLMEHAADAILLLDSEGRIDLANSAAENLFGWRQGELAGKCLSDLLPHDLLGGGTLSSDFLERSHSIVGGGPRELLGQRWDGSTFPLELATSEVRIDGRRLFVAIGRDITVRKATEAALRDTEQRLRTITANMPGMVFQRSLGADGRLSFRYVSEGCRDFLGIEPEELMANPQLYMAALSTDQRQPYMARLTKSAQTLEPFDEEISVRGPDGRRRWLRGQSRPTRKPNGDVVWDGIILDVTDRKNAEQRLSFLAYYDPLTRLPNRAAFVERLAAAREQADDRNTMLAVAILSVDRFSMVNATMGHAIGNQVLVSFADMLQASMGRDDVLSRLSGDRFLLMMGGFRSVRDAAEALEKFHTQTQTPVWVGDEEFEISVSLGASVYPRDGDDAETLIKHAEAALQRGKQQGTAAFQVFTTEMGANANKVITLQNRLRRAVEQGEFIPFYQPQIDLTTGRIVGMEALVRWQNPEIGMVSPADFIPVAEESGLIDGICAAMLFSCAHQNRLWQDMGLPAIPVAVNVSGRQFQYSRRLVSALERALGDSGLHPRYLEIELTESSAMRDADNAIAVVRTLNDMGLSCAIDDFGTGYSSLSVLKRFPISKLKIDRSFVMDINTDPNDAAIVDAIISMARALRLKVVAEGVEHIQHLEFLQSLGCDQMQGYLFSRPLPAADMEKLLVEGRHMQFDGQA